MRTTVIFFVAIVTSLFGFSQNNLTQGVVVISQTMSSDNDEMNAQLAMMGDMRTTTYFKNDKSRTEVSSPMTGDMIVITDGASKEMVTFMDNPMLGKKYIKGSLDIAQSALNDIVITKGDETKMFLNFECQQYFVTSSVQGQPMEMEVFTTDAINAYSQQTAPYGDEIKGFPLYVSLSMNQMGSNIKVVSNVIEIKKEVLDDEKFSLEILDGYAEMKQE